MLTNDITRPGTLHSPDAPLPVLYREYADAVAREALRGDCACRRCGGTGWEDCPDYDPGDSLAAAVYGEDRMTVCGGCDGEGFAPAPICTRCGEAIYSRCPDRDGCCETCAPGLRCYWGRVTDPRTGVTCYRDGLCLD